MKEEFAGYADRDYILEETAKSYVIDCRDAGADSVFRLEIAKTAVSIISGNIVTKGIALNAAVAVAEIITPEDDSE